MVFQRAEAAEVLLSATERFTQSIGDNEEMVRQARILADATSQLVNAITSQANNSTDTEQRRRLVDAAKVLADATANLVETAKVRVMGYVC